MIATYNVIEILDETEYHVDFKNKRLLKQMTLTLDNPSGYPSEFTVTWTVDKEDVEIIKKFRKITR